MGVPTHGPSCRTVLSRPARCQTCDGFVYYWGCTCGSRVLFDVAGETWSKHRCTGAAPLNTDPKSGKNKSRSKDEKQPNVKVINTYTYGVLSEICYMCGKSVRIRDWEAHNYYTHGIGKKPASGSSSDPYLKRSKRAKTSARSSRKAGSNRILAVCPECGAKVLRKNLTKHLTKKCSNRQSANVTALAPATDSNERRLPNGTVPTKPITKCEVCSTPVRLDRLKDHMRRVHPAQATRNNPRRQGGR